MTIGGAPSSASGAGQMRPRSDLSAHMRGAAEALSVMSRRGPGDRLRAVDEALGMLIRHVDHVEPAAWRSAGLQLSDRYRAAGHAARAGGAQTRIQVSDPAVIYLAHVAMRLLCSTRPAAQRPKMWDRFASFFATSAKPISRRMEATALFSRIEAGDVSPEIVEGLFSVYEWRRETYGRDAYLTSLARTNLAIAYRIRATGTDLADATEFCRQETRARNRQYGPDHPFTLVARNNLARCLLAQAEAAGDERTRHALARQAYEEAGRARAARDSLYGPTSSNATLSRRHQGHALLLLGDLERARSCLRYAIAFETKRNDNTEWRRSGWTHLLLARVCTAGHDRDAARIHANTAWRLLTRDEPHSRACRDAAALLQQLDIAKDHDPGPRDPGLPGKS